MTRYQSINVPDNTEHLDIVNDHEVCLLAQTDTGCTFGYVVADGGDITDDRDDTQAGEHVENLYVPDPVFWLKRAEMITKPERTELAKLLEQYEAEFSFNSNDDTWSLRGKLAKSNEGIFYSRDWETEWFESDDLNDAELNAIDYLNE